MTPPPDFPSSLLDTFAHRFGRPATIASRAPGRINLIGEHVDYTGGYVLPCAIEAACFVAGAPRDDGRIRLYSAELGRHAEAGPGPLEPLAAEPWANYPLGAIAMLREAGIGVPGFDAAISSAVPIGAGLSSSAAIEVAMARFGLELAGATLPPMDVAKLCRRAENEFVGVPCGLMDQFVSVFARAGHACLLNCRTLDYRYVPLRLGGHALLLCDTGVRHALGDSEYAKRQVECARGLAAVHKTLGPQIADLGMLSENDFARAAPAMDALAVGRVRHAVTENARVLQTVEALERGDLTAVGRNLSASHASLRDDYHVSCPELDIVAEAAQAQPGVLGARMVGGGFGGCVLALLEAGAEEAVKAALTSRYRESTGRVLTFHNVRVGGGAEAWQVE